MYCQGCEQEVADDAETCPSCGTIVDDVASGTEDGFDLEEYHDSRGVKIGVTAGAGAFAIGWLLALLWYLSTDPQGPTDMSVVVAAGYFFYNGHLLSITGGVGLQSMVALAFPFLGTLTAGLALRPFTEGQGRIRAVQGALVSYTVLMIVVALLVLQRTVDAGFGGATSLGPSPLLAGIFGFGYALLILGLAAGAQNHAD